MSMDRILAVSDIHGQFHALQRALSAAEFSPSRDHLWVLGDMVDRGPDSYRVVMWLQEIADVILQGNHEDAWARWAITENAHITAQLDDNGGQATRESFGDVRQLKAIARWFATLPLWAQHHDLLAVHAGIRPFIPLQQQLSDDLLWIRDEFFENPYGTDAFATIVFGHTPTLLLPRSQAERVWRWRNRIGIDTAAGWGGPVTVVDLVSGTCFPSEHQPYSVLPALWHVSQSSTAHS